VKKLIFPLFLLDFTDKEENLTTNFFKLEPYIYKPSLTYNFQSVLTSDKFKTKKEYYLYLSQNNIHDIENRYVQDTHTITNPIGNLLFDFLNIDSINSIFLKKLIFKYGIVTLNDPVGTNFSDDFNLFYDDPRASEYDDSIEIDYFESRLDIGIKEILDSYINLHKNLREIINFSYNINEKKYLNGLTPSQRYYIFIHSYQSDKYMSLFKYLSDVSFNQDFDFSEYDKSIKNFHFNSPEALAKYIKNEYKKNHNFHIKNYLYSFNSLMSVYYFCVLYFIENNIPIKICKNCGKYFVPENRISSVYCNRIFKNKKTCREVGASNAYNEKLKKDEVNSLYRKTLSAKKMLVNRNPDIPMYLEKYEKWKTEANKFKQDIKEGKKTEEEFKNWIEKTRKI
jgi:hypothetical protein